MHRGNLDRGMAKAVFLDRDGVINRNITREERPGSPRNLDEMEYLPGVEQAIVSLKDAGFRVIVVTNQPEVASGHLGQDIADAMKKKVMQDFPVDDYLACYHLDQDGCSCRKPNPGMLVDASVRWSLELKESIMVGDRWRDIGAGRAAGCRTILVRGTNNSRQYEKADVEVDSLLEASALILSHKI